MQAAKKAVLQAFELPLAEGLRYERRAMWALAATLGVRGQGRFGFIVAFANSPAQGEVPDMSLAGTGAVAIWHDIAPEGRSELYAWHGKEHMPERTGIPGFLCGRRYVAIDGQPEFFNLHETDSPRRARR